MERKRIIVERRQKRNADKQDAHKTTTYEQKLETVAVQDFGQPNYYCSFCRAWFWYQERLKSSKSRLPIYSLCCYKGRIKLPLLRALPPPLDTLLDYKGGKESKLFRKNIRSYNSIFSFTSIGAAIDQEINKQKGPYIFKISGQNYHRIGSLLPPEGHKPKYAQLYVHDTTNETANRITTLFSKETPSSGINDKVVKQLIKMFDRYNEIVKAFRMARDSFQNNLSTSIRLQLYENRQNVGLQYDPPTCPEITALIPNDFGQTDGQRDIIVNDRIEGFQRISDLHPSFMAMQYPILFPYREDGYRLGIPYCDVASNKKHKRSSITMREFYVHRIQHRDEEITRLINSGRLFQQYIVDAFSCREEDRLSYIKHHQNDIRSEIYQGLEDAFFRGDTSGKDIGKRVILPSSFTGSPRYMIQNYHDAMAICKFYGHPDLFITFTCNVQWSEIKSALQLIPGQRAEDRPDIISRIFKIKVDEFISNIKKNKYFGEIIANVYTIEFQKRGLPHVHILFWLHADHKYPTPLHIDQIISAEIPDCKLQPKLFECVNKFMIHGPCGLADTHAKCMIAKYCTRYFPRQFHSKQLSIQTVLPLTKEETITDL